MLQAICIDMITLNIKENGFLTKAILEYKLPQHSREKVIKNLAKMNCLSLTHYRHLSEDGITILDLSHSNLQDADHALFFNFWNLGIEIVDLNHAYFSEMLAEVFIRMKTCNVKSAGLLLYLDMSYCEGVTDMIISLVTDCCSNLMTLMLASSPMITCSSLLAISNSSFRNSLTVLDYSRNSVSDASILSLGNLSNLKQLTLAGAFGTIYTPPSFLSACLVLLDLSSLQLASSTICSVLYLVLPRLTELRLVESLLESDDLRRLLQSLPQSTILPLIRVDLSWCEELSSQVIGDLLFLCPNLTMLALRSTHVDSATIRIAAETCLHLTEVLVPRCDGIDDEAVLALAKIGMVRSLDVSWTFVSDQSVLELLTHCPFLEKLDLDGCKQLTTAIFDMLFNKVTAPSLQYLGLGWVNMCSKQLAESLSIVRPACRISDYYKEVYLAGEVFE